MAGRFAMDSANPLCKYFDMPQWQNMVEYLAKQVVLMMISTQVVVMVVHGI